MALVVTPYNARESVAWVVKNVMGLVRKNPGGVASMPDAFDLNDGVTPACRICFVGDIAPLNGRTVAFGSGLRHFLKGCDHLVGNMEGTITTARNPGIAIAFDQRHSTRIIDVLESLFPANRTYLSVSNNHSGDYGSKAFFASVEMLATHGFHPFGWMERPHADIGDMIRIVSGTMWSNRACRYVSRMESAAGGVKPGAFNVCFPHFGYELELYPRTAIMEHARRLLGSFDAIVGHHPHCPQPVTAEFVSGETRLLAYSLGDFLGRFRTKNYQYGIIVKIDVGKGPAGRILAGHCEWRFTRCIPTGKDSLAVVTVGDELGVLE